MSNVISVKAITRRFDIQRLQAVIDASTDVALEEVLKEIHDKAVEKAPHKSGLLKNSIVYSVDGKDFKGVNSYSNTDSVVDEALYTPEKLGVTFGAKKEKGLKQGFVGTFVQHSIEKGFDKQRKHKVNGELGEKGVGTTYPYANRIEYEQPFLRPAVYETIDTGTGTQIMAKVYKRDIETALASGLSSEVITRIL